MLSEKISSYVNIIPLLLSWQFMHMSFLTSRGLCRAFQMKPSP